MRRIILTVFIFNLAATSGCKSVTKRAANSDDESDSTVDDFRQSSENTFPELPSNVELLSNPFTPNSTYSIESAENECGQLWGSSDLNIQADQIKNYSGDTLAAYGLMTYEKRGLRNNYVFKLRGKMPAARFVSFETYYGGLQQKEDHLFDFEVLGQDQMLSTERYRGQEYEIFLSETDQPDIAGAFNLKTRSSRLLSQKYSLFYRVYLPEGLRSLSEADLPKIYAYEPGSGEPKECPSFYETNQVDVPQSIVNIYKARRQVARFTFESSPNWFSTFGLGGNTAVPRYVVGFNRLEEDSVTSIKFLAPTFSDQSGVSNPEVRYWSLCFQNWANNQTLTCLSDLDAKVDSDGFVHIVFSRENSQIRQIAEQNNYNFIADKRVEGQIAIGFAYRNLLPTEDFEQRYMYQGEYLPVGATCTMEQYLSESSRTQSCSP